MSLIKSIDMYRLAHLKGRANDGPQGKKGIPDDEIRAMASGSGATVNKEDDLGEVQRMIEQAANELQLDAEKTVRGRKL